LKKIIFVCTGNTCRSPLAEMIMKDLLKKANINHIEIISRGLSVFGESPVNAHVETILAKYNINLSPHCSTLLSEDDFTSDTVVLTMTNHHKQLASNRFSAYSNNIYTLYEYVDGSNEDVHDPYGGNINIYENCFAELLEVLTILVKDLPTL